MTEKQRELLNQVLLNLTSARQYAVGIECRAMADVCEDSVAKLNQILAADFEA